MSIFRTFPILAAAFALIYIIAAESGLAAVTYYPKLGTWRLWTQPGGAEIGPAMHWYGWMITAAAGAVVVSLAALPLTRSWAPPAWIGWAVPLATMVAFLYFLRDFFIH
jgi:hypothetical protein